ncbi:MAG: hypothetical protein R2748_32230 [Bryobacterales bacterium]
MRVRAFVRPHRDAGARIARRAGGHLVTEFAGEHRFRRHVHCAVYVGVVSPLADTSRFDAQGLDFGAVTPIVMRGKPVVVQ